MYVNLHHMAKIVMLRPPEKVAEKIQTIADKKAIGLSTAIREMVSEHTTECAPVQPSKAETSAASTYQFRRVCKHVIK